MSGDKVTYSFLKQDGAISFRSKVESFNLDHVTEKDSVSFFRSFSNYAAMDTGLLPVDGTGMLALRKAGNHTQVTFQHKPGLYYVNWGAHEGDKAAVSYLVAQPYRIVIIDFVDDNLLGARTFYSPIPATHPGIQLYHVNLPNINCRGYRGNGVGWICLYHNQDWSQMPFNERLARAIERCSGIETYNDANMSETDGPRFYIDHYKNNPSYNYIWSPKLWEAKSQEEGFEWTLDDNLWVPIMVKSRDEQDRHYTGEGAIPLTLADAIVGQYNAYYSDSYHPKPINALTNPSLKLDPNMVMNWFIQSYNSSTTNYVGIDTLHLSEQTRQDIANKKLNPQPLHTSDEEVEHDDDEDDDSIMCSNCNENYDEDDVTYIEANESYYCQSCLENNFTFCENTSDWLSMESPNLLYDEMEEVYYDTSAFAKFSICTCGKVHGVMPLQYSVTFKSMYAPNQWTITVPKSEDEVVHVEVCSSCIDTTLIDDNAIERQDCHSCGVFLPDVDFHTIVDGTLYRLPSFGDEDTNLIRNYAPSSYKYICNHCAAKHHTFSTCVCGSCVPSFEFVNLISPIRIQLSENNYPHAYMAVTDSAKSNDMDISDSYLFTVHNVCRQCAYLKKISQSESDNYEYTVYTYDSDKYYWLPSQNGPKNLSAQIESMFTEPSAVMFRSILNKADFGLIPLSNPF